MTTTNGRDQRRGHPDDAALVNESAASTPAPGSASDPPTPAVGRVAFHESAHATLAERLGVGVVNVTMRPPRTYMGPLERRDRDAIEARIVAVLAGGVADLYTRRTSGYLPDVTAEEENALALAAEYAALSPRHRELLETYAAGQDGALALCDDTAALALSAALVGTEARLHVAWLGAVAERLVHETWPAIVRVAAVLEQHGELSGAEVAAVIEAAGWRLPKHKEI